MPPPKDDTDSAAHKTESEQGSQKKGRHAFTARCRSSIPSAHRRLKTEAITARYAPGLIEDPVQPQVSDGGVPLSDRHKGDVIERHGAVGLSPSRGPEHEIVPPQSFRVRHRVEMPVEDRVIAVCQSLFKAFKIIPVEDFGPLINLTVVQVQIMITRDHAGAGCELLGFINRAVIGKVGNSDIVAARMMTGDCQYEAVGIRCTQCMHP